MLSRDNEKAYAYKSWLWTSSSIFFREPKNENKECMRDAVKYYKIVLLFTAIVKWIVYYIY